MCTLYIHVACMILCVCVCYMPFFSQLGVSALMIEVAGRCRIEVVEELAKAGANLNLQNNVCWNIYNTGIFIEFILTAEMALAYSMCILLMYQHHLHVLCW